jgi:hypothetical protein
MQLDATGFMVKDISDGELIACKRAQMSGALGHFLTPKNDAM